MTAEEKIKRITELVGDLDLVSNITQDEMIDELHKCTFFDIKEMLWRFYCFASDVKEVIVMKDGGY